MVGDFTKRTIWLACLFLVLSTTFAFGQGIVAGSIAGTVLDPQKAVVVGAKVAAKNVATTVEFKSTTNDQGYFSIRSIPIGTYRVAVDAPNFKKLEVDGVVVSTGLTTDMGPLTLALGATTETVTVEAAAPLIETTTAQGGATFRSQETLNLPVAGGFDQLALFLPGVVAAGDANFTNNNGAQFAVNGQRDRSNNFQIDGQNNNDNSVAGPAIFLSNQDALQEVSIITNNFSVEFGRNSGSVVNYVTKSGTNHFHGSVFEYYTGNWGDSLANEEKSPLITSTPHVPRYTENRWGGTIGGPVVPDKIFFFASYTQDTAKSGGATFDSGSSLTPTPAGLTQLASCFPGNTGLAIVNQIGPYAVAAGSPQPGPVVTPEDVTVGATTCTGVPFSSVSRSLPGLFNNYEAIGRADFVMSPKDNFFARYLFQQQLFTGAFGTGRFAAGAVVDVPSRSQQIALDWTRSWTPHLVNQVRFSYERLQVGFQGGTFPNCVGQTLSSCPTGIGFLDNTLAFGMQNNLPQARLVNNSQWQDNASLQKGRHTFKFGGSYERQRSPNFFLPNYNGTYTFADFSSLMSNNTTTTTLSLADGSPNIPFKEQDASAYFGDDWRIKDNLTVNLGARWEFTQQALNNLAKATIARELGPNPFWDTTLPLFITTVPTVPNVYHNLAPNVGFAWTPHMLKGIFGDNKTVIRGGFRMAYDPAFYNMFLNVATAAPAVNLNTFICPAPCLTGGFGFDVRAAHLSNIPTGPGINPGGRSNTRVTGDFHNPYAEEWTLGVQREVTSKIAAEARYLGTHTVGEFQTINANPSLSGLIANNFASFIPAGVVPCATPPPGVSSTGRQNCNFTNLRIRANSAFASYHSLQTQLKVRAWHGFTGVAAYTFSKTIDNTSEIFGSGTSYGSGANLVAGAQDPYNIASGERALSAFDYPHSLSLYWNYDLPFGKGQQGMMKHLLGGWSLAGTYRYLSGQLWTPAQLATTTGSRAQTSCQNSFDAAFLGSVSTCRPFLSNPGAPVDSVGRCTNALAPDCGLIDFFTLAPTAASAVHWIYNNNVADAFFLTPYGNTSRNPHIRGDSINTVNLNLIKDTRVAEKVSLKLEANVFNAFNRMFRGVPDPFFVDGQYAANGGSFGNTFFNSSLGGTAGANSTLTGTGRRRIILGAHIIF